MIDFNEAASGEEDMGNINFGQDEDHPSDDDLDSVHTNEEEEEIEEKSAARMHKAISLKTAATNKSKQVTPLVSREFATKVSSTRRRIVK